MRRMTSRGGVVLAEQSLRSTRGEQALVDAAQDVALNGTEVGVSKLVDDLDVRLTSRNEPRVRIALGEQRGGSFHSRA